MTSTAPGAHPLPEEVDALLDPSGGDAHVGAHVAGCDRCQEVRDDLRQVRSLLGERARSLPPEPPDLAARIAAALAAEPPLTGSSTVSATAAASGTSRDVRPTTVVSLDERRRRPRRQQLTTWLAAAASVAVIGAGGTFLLSQVVGGASDSSAGSAEVPAMAPQDSSQDSGGPMGAEGGGQESAPIVTATTGAGGPRASGLSGSGTDYTRPDLVAQAQLLLSRGGLTGVPDDATQGYRVSEAAALDACLDAVGRPGAEPVVTDLATFEGQDAAVVVVPDQVGYEVLVVPARCGAGDDRVLASAHLD